MNTAPAFTTIFRCTAHAPLEFGLASATIQPQAARAAERWFGQQLVRQYPSVAGTCRRHGGFAQQTAFFVVW